MGFYRFNTDESYSQGSNIVEKKLHRGNENLFGTVYVQTDEKLCEYEDELAR